VNVRAGGCDVYIGRPSIWGNPFIVGKHGTREEVIKKHEAYLRKNLYLIANLYKLAGKRIGCYCAPKPCHGDNYIKLIHEFGLDL